MKQTCETCGRSWGDRAMFCGACGALLNRPLPSRGGPDHGGAPTWWRRPFVAGVLAVIAIVGIVAAVPTLSIQRTDPIENTAIDMPEADDLQGAPAGTRPRRSVDPPEVSCTVDDVEVDCVTWSRGLVPPMDGQTDGPASWPMIVGDHVLLVGDGEVEAVDAGTGTRLWRMDVAQESYPLGATEGLLLLQQSSDTSAVDLATGEPLWSVKTFPQPHGHVVHDDIVLTGPGPGDEARLVARAASTGEALWRWQSPPQWFDLAIRPLDQDRLLVVASGEGVAVLDPRTGNELSRADGLPEGWVIGVVNDTVLTLTQPDMDPSEPNPAGDPGAVVTGTNLVDGTVRWQHDVRSSDGWFQLVGDAVLAPSSRHLTALDSATGQTIWEVETSESEGLAQYQLVGPWQWRQRAAEQAPAIAVTLSQPGGVVRGRDLATGALLWERELSREAWHAVVTEDHVVVQTSGGVRVVSVTTGDELLGVDSPELQMTDTDPFILFDPVSGYVTRVELPGALAR